MQVKWIGNSTLRYGGLTMQPGEVFDYADDLRREDEGVRKLLVIQAEVQEDAPIEQPIEAPRKRGRKGKR